MRRIDRLEPEFVEEIPRTLEPGRLYISIFYTTMTHLCCCGCGSEVVTSLHPRRWSLTFDGETISLNPSVGNWSLPCRSHYVITHNRVRWAESWSQERVDAVRARDRAALAEYFDENVPAVGADDVDSRPRHWLREGLRSLIRRRRRSLN